MVCASWRRGKWTRKTGLFLLLSSFASGASQAFDYVALSHAGVQGFTILHSFVTFFACVISAVVLRTRISLPQWLGCFLVVCGLVLTGVPHPMDSQVERALAARRGGAANARVRRLPAQPPSTASAPQAPR